MKTKPFSAKCVELIKRSWMGSIRGMMVLICYLRFSFCFIVYKYNTSYIGMYIVVQCKCLFKLNIKIQAKN